MKSLLKTLILCTLIRGGTRGWTDDVPVAPISSTQVENWGEVYEISTKKVSLIVSPQVGAVVSIRPSGMEEQLLSPLQIQAMPQPVEEKAWESRAWRTSAGKQVVMLQRNLGEPYFLRVVHVIELNPTGEHLRQTTRITGLAPEAVDFLNPAIETTVLPPDLHKPSDTADVYLVYGTVANTWKSHWEIELPEDRLSPEVEIQTSPTQLVFSSRPRESLVLPPQGWTVLCSLDLFWSPQSSTSPSHDRKN
ncbi:hypothetical protein P0Y35_01945 [Kiritimatiellaeota bacterium B1221]|nr:hypothetical protein [Kiritimatiellaeota bacterium B1221]